jgi:hypothetical protein
MALTFSVVDTWDDGKRIHVGGTVAATGNYSTEMCWIFRKCRLLRRLSRLFRARRGWMVSLDTITFSIPARP